MIKIETTFSEEVRAAIEEKKAIVALESTIISHGLPRPTNLEVAMEVEEIVRGFGAVPATIAILDGKIAVGLNQQELEAISQRDDILKASIRDLPIIIAQGKSAATTVAATSQIAAKYGIKTFATGGLGGIHRGASESFDESADLTALSKISITIVCAGVKSILDVAATLERLETLSIPVVGYQSNSFPGFYLADSGFPLEYRVNSADEIAKIAENLSDIAFPNSSAALIVTNACRKPMDPSFHQKILDKALASVNESNISGKGVTPHLLDYFHKNSDGQSLAVNIEIIKSNSALAAEIAIALNKPVKKR
jgi:pseudouridine-5'-phosphate glycosidase